jgi:beta-lactamase regulating signal transducer with metallopeptidase domain/ketosteroid isomerase-like protein
MIDLLNSFSQTWWNWMAPMFWQVSLLIIIISVIDLLIRNWAWPQIRYTLWSLILLKLLIPPTWTTNSSIIPNMQLIIEKEIGVEIVNKDEVQPIPLVSESLTKPIIPDETKLNGKSFELNEQNNNYSYSQLSNLSWKFYLMALWILGIALFAGLLIRRISKLRKWHEEQEKRKNIPAWFHELLLKTAKKLSIERLPSIVFSIEAVTPAVYGVFHPVLLLPEKYIDALSEEEAEHVLLHELAHVKRGDLIVHGICLLLQIIYWFNPLLIWARKQMKHIREICCDLTIANVLRDKTVGYRQTLVNTARELLTESLEPGMGLLGLFEEPFRLISRLKWLEKKSWENRRMASGVAIAVGLLFTAFVLPMGNIENNNLFYPDKSISEISEIDNLKEKIELLNKELNTAFIEWDLESIPNYYTEDIILDQDGRPSLVGKETVTNDYYQQKSSGVKFISLDNFIVDLWKDGENISVVETFLYSISLKHPNVTISGSGKAYTIWQAQKDGSLKIKYSIFNTDSPLPIISEN